MKKILLFIIMFSFFSSANANYDRLAYDFQFNGLEGNPIKLKNYTDKVIIVVNVASRCGFTNQYEDLQKLWSTYKDQGLIVIGVPTNNFRQELNTNKEIKEFCESTFGINFPMTEKIDVLGDKAHPFYQWAKKNYGNSAVPKWNFHKIIINKKGKIVDTFTSITKPTSKKFVNLIEKEIKN